MQPLLQQVKQMVHCRTGSSESFGAVAAGIDGTSIGTAIALAIGIGLQNLPEGTAVAMPLRREGLSRGKAFFLGQLSGVVEPIAAVLGAWLVTTARAVLPYALAFAAGAIPPRDWLGR